MRSLQPDETTPIELVGKANPSIDYSGYETLTFEPRPGDGRRVEWVSPKIAKALTRAPYVGLFRIADDLRPENQNSAERVMEVIRANIGEIREMLKEEVVAIPLTAQPSPPDVTMSHEADDESKFLAMSKEALLKYADAHGVEVDGRWNKEKILATIQRETAS